MLRDLGEIRPRRLAPPWSAPPPPRRAHHWLLWLLFLLCLPALPLLVLRWVDPPLTSYMLQSPVKPVQHRWVGAAALGRSLPLAAVASEDQKFPQHWGFDLASIEKVLAEPGGPRRGASTISQQTAKNLFLWPGGYVRKGIEAWITLWLELLWPKARILEVYLNIAEFGPGIYGAEAGAQWHFGVPAAALSARQAAQLIAILPAPRALSPNPPSPHVTQRADWILRQMDNLGPGYLNSGS